MKHIITAFILILLTATSTFAAPATPPTPAQVLQYVDNVRAPSNTFTFHVIAKEVNKPDSSPNTFDVLVRDYKKSIVLFREPVKQRGRVLLMDHADMWIFIPGTSRALRISPQQQLVGGVSYADIARVVFSLDYTPTHFTVVDENNAKLLKISLTAKASNTPYRAITLYVTPYYEPVRAEFFSLSGKLLRTAYYDNYQTILGKRRPMSIRMVDAVRSSDDVLLTYTTMTLKETPLSYFQPSYMNQLR